MKHRKTPNPVPVSRIIVVAITLVAALLLAGCGGGDGGAAPPLIENPPLNPPVTPTPPIGTDDTWTFLVYICSDNNLQYYDYLDVREMEKVGSTNNVKIVLQWDRSRPDDYVKWGGCQRFLVEKNTANSPGIVSKSLENLGTTDMGSRQTLTDFVTWGIQNYPADKYALVLWNHGSGWKENSASWLTTRGIAYDDGSGNHLTIEDVRRALENALSSKKLELVSMDACLMGNVEVAYDLKDVARYLVFSEYTVPGAGLPYDTVLHDLVVNPGMNGADFGKRIVQRYGERYSNTPRTTQSAIDLSKIAAVAAAVDDLAKSAMSHSPEAGIALYESSQQASKVDEGNYSDYRDLGHFATIANTNLQDADLKAKASVLLSKLQEAVIAEYHHHTISNTTGLSIWSPTPSQFTSSSGVYNTLLFAKDTTWDEFLSWVTSPYRNTPPDMSTPDTITPPDPVLPQDFIVEELVQ